MAKSRKDNKGRVLLKGESQRKSKPEYVYTYTDIFGNRRFVYASTLKELREKEDAIKRDSHDGINLYLAKTATVNLLFDRYMAGKAGLQENTRFRYEYLYDTYVRNGFGKVLVKDVKYSDVKGFYVYLLKERKLAIKTVDLVHTLLHPVFETAVRDDVIRKNPTNGVIPDIRKELGSPKKKRHPLTIEQQRSFMQYVENHVRDFKWWPIFTVLLGTGLRAGELVGLRWEDLDFEKGLIDVNHNVIYRKNNIHLPPEEYRISTPKTEAGYRKIPMTPKVRLAFEMELEKQKQVKYPPYKIDGMSGFVFLNKHGQIYCPDTINYVIKRITQQHNEAAIKKGKEGNTEMVLLPIFTCHHLRHTFCTRLCENESNLKVIQTIMGHASIKTTMDIYAECAESKKIETIERLSKTLDVF